jgi:N4-gp56 family major capsid protein
MAGQLWSVNTLGGYMWAPELSNLLRTAVQPLCKFRQFCDAKDFTDKGLHKGQSFYWDVYNDVATQGTTLTETTTIPVTNYTIAQGTGTVTELGNSVPYTGLLDNMSKHPVQEIINKVLKNDTKKALDTQAWGQFVATLLQVVPVAGTDATNVTLTTNGTTTATNSVNMHKNHIKSIVDAMKERNIPLSAANDNSASQIGGIAA